MGLLLLQSSREATGVVRGGSYAGDCQRRSNGLKEEIKRKAAGKWRERRMEEEIC